MIRALLICAALVTPLSVTATEPLRFRGTIEAASRAEVTTLVDGVVRAIRFGPGERVNEGQLLFEIEPVEDLESRVRSALALVDRRSAELADRRLVLDQQRELRQRAATSELRFEQAGTAVAVAEAELASAEAELAAAERARARTRITAPIAGVVDRPLAVLGTFVEAEADAPLTVVSDLDPVHVVYAVPYADRLRAMEIAGTDTVAELLERFEISLVLPGAQTYPHKGKPFQSATGIDPTTGALTTWATVPNPDLILLPGLEVDVHAQPRPTR